MARSIPTKIESNFLTPMTNNFTFKTHTALANIERILEVLGKERLTSVELAAKVNLEPRTIRFYLQHLRKPDGRRVRLVFDKGSTMPRYEALRKGDPGPLLPDEKQPLNKRDRAIDARYRLKKKLEREAKTAKSVKDSFTEREIMERAEKVQNIQPWRDPFVAAFFGNASNVNE